MISIITVVLNEGNNLLKTIDSVRNCGQKVEFIIVDGDSQDNTLSIIKNNLDIVNKWISEPDKGIYDAFNKGWNLARNENHILYLGAGDQIHVLPDLNVVESHDVIYGKVQLSTVLFKSVVDFRLKMGNTLHHQALLVKKSLHPESPFNLKYKVYADFDFNQRLYKKGLTFTFSENFIATALPDGISSTFRAEEALEIVYTNFGLFWKYLATFYYLLQGKSIK